MNKCFGLCRVSSENQSNNTSLKHQQESIKRYTEYHQLELVDVISEVYTGMTSNRDSINQIKDLVDKKMCDMVIVMKLDRLMRSFSEGVVFIKYLLDNNVRIISTTEDINSDSVSGRFFINLILSLSNFERDTIVDRLKQGKINKFNTGKRNGSRLCFGYRKDSNDNVVVDDTESKIVKYIFKKWSDYKKMNISKSKMTRRLLKLLKKKGYGYRDKDIRHYHLRQILSNQFYIGKMTYGELENKHNYETIISKRLFNLVNYSSVS